MKFVEKRNRIEKFKKGEITERQKEARIGRQVPFTFLEKKEFKERKALRAAKEFAASKNNPYRNVKKLANVKRKFV